jgi:hypothetical protein
MSTPEIANTKELNINNNKLHYMDATRLYLNIMTSKNYITIDNNIIYIYNYTNGLWTNCPHAIKSTIINCNEIGDYALNFIKINKVFNTIIPVANEVPKNFISNNIHKSFGKFLFNDGIYDAVTRTFAESYDLNMVFTGKIERNFVKRDVLSQELYDKINNELFTISFLNSVNKESYGSVMKYILARALHGGFESDNLIYLCIGDRFKNAYKNIHKFITQESFGEYVARYSPDIFKSSKINPKITTKFDCKRLVISEEYYYEKFKINDIFVSKILSDDNIKIHRPTFLIMLDYNPIIQDTNKSIIKTIEYPVFNRIVQVNDDIDTKYRQNLNEYVSYYFYIITDLMYHWYDPNEISYPEL